jgi:hypothetical protein
MGSTRLCVRQHSSENLDHALIGLSVLDRNPQRVPAQALAHAADVAQKKASE